MKRCPECGTSYPDAARFCERDGKRLVLTGDAAAPEASGARAAPQRPPTAPVPRRTPSAAPPTRRPDTRRPGSAPARPAGPPPEAPSGPGRAAYVAVGLLVALALALGGYGGWIYVQNREAEARAADRQRQEAEVAASIQSALAEGAFVQPEGQSAYDWYNRLRADFPRSPRIAEVEARVLPELRERLDEFYRSWIRSSSAPDSEWPRVRRMARWASEMAPESRRLRAQHLYADARYSFETGDSSGADAQYRAAIEAWPEWALPYNSLGVLMVRRENYGAAAGWYEEAAARDPSWAFPRLNLGGVYARLGRYDDARRSLQRADELGANTGGAWANLSTVCVRAEAYDCGLGAAREALASGGSGFDRERMQDRVRYLSGYIQSGYVGVIGYQEFIDLVESRFESGE